MTSYETYSEGNICMCNGTTYYYLINGGDGFHTLRGRSGYKRVHFNFGSMDEMELLVPARACEGIARIVASKILTRHYGARAVEWKLY